LGVLLFLLLSLAILLLVVAAAATTQPPFLCTHNSRLQSFDDEFKWLLYVSSYDHIFFFPFIFSSSFLCSEQDFFRVTVKWKMPML
jgi:hypothetical protein